MDDRPLESAELNFLSDRGVFGNKNTIRVDQKKGNGG